MIDNNAAVTDRNNIILDKEIKDPETRSKIVEQIIKNTSPEKLSPRFLEVLSNYIVFAQSKQEKKEKKILTNNQLKYIHEREISYESLMDKFEAGEDAIYSLITNDKNIIFAPKKQISQRDLEEIPYLKELKENIEKVAEQFENAGRDKKGKLLTTLIDLRRDQYEIKASFKQPIFFMNVTKGGLNKVSLDEQIIIVKDKKGDIVFKTEGFLSLINPDDISLLLCNYDKLVSDSWGKVDNDVFYLLLDLEVLVDKALKQQYPMLFDILVYKIDKISNVDIQQLLLKKYNQTYTSSYISVLWRKKIPKILAEQARKDYVTWYYTEREKGFWKKCSCCGEIKPANELFFSKNKNSADLVHSVCKDCRNKDYKNKKEQV